MPGYFVPEHRSRDTEISSNRLKLVFPGPMPSTDSIKSLHKGIHEVTKASHLYSKSQLNTHYLAEFSSSTAAEKAFNALHNKKVEGGHLVVHRVKPPQKKSTIKKKVVLKELVIRHLPEGVTKADIKRAFPESSRIKLSKKTRTVIFSVSAARAVVYLSDPIRQLNGHELEVSTRTPTRRMVTRSIAKEGMDVDDTDLDDQHMD